MNADEKTAKPTARCLLRAADVGALATLDHSTGEPYASLALVAVDHDATPVLLLSTLAEHTGNLTQDPRVSLLIDGTAGLGSRLAGARISVQGEISVSIEPRHRARFLARHPDAEGYADFADFSFYRIDVARVHLIAGFGRIDWIDGREVLQPEALDLPLIDAEADIIEHMNADHGDAVDLYAKALAGRPGAGWTMTGCDSEGCDLRLGGAVCRICFDKAVRDAEGARVELVGLAARARKILNESAASC